MMYDLEYIPRIARRPPQRTRAKPPPKPPSRSVSRRSDTVCRHKALWKDDGDLAITALMSDGRTQLFRVHQQPLMDNSVILRDMIQYTDKFINSKTFKDLRWIELPEDAGDVANFLRETLNLEAPYDDSLKGMGLTDFVRGILRVATKYQANSLVDKLRAVYISAWPQTLDQWDEEEDSFDEIAFNFSDDQPIDGRFAEDWALQEPVAAIRLAQEFNIPEILPTAFYHLSRIPLHNDWLTRRFQGAGISPPPMYFSMYSLTARWDLLSPDDRTLMVLGREQIMTYLVDNWVPAVMHNCSIVCQDPDYTCQLHLPAVTTLCPFADDEATRIDPLRLLRRNFARPIERIKRTYHLCNACAEECQRLALDARVHVWKMLPQFFRIVQAETDVVLPDAFLEVFGLDRV